MAREDRLRVEEALRRIDELVAAVGHVADPVARETARELIETVLDVHGIALARIMARLAVGEGGRALADALARDEQVKALLLLYGLHPDDAETRLRDALAAMRTRLEAVGVAVVLGRVTASAASLRATGDFGSDSALRRDIEEALTDAAPDLDEIAIEWVERMLRQPRRMPAGEFAAFDLPAALTLSRTLPRRRRAGRGKRRRLHFREARC